MWESKFQPHFYKSFHEIMLSIFQDVFEEKATRLFKEANNDFLSIGRWFEEEPFTYIWVFDSLGNLHVFPLYVPDKLLTRELTYQTVGNGLCKVLNHAKKTIWPSFSISCGVYAMENFKHAVLEIDKIQCFKFPTVPNR